MAASAATASPMPPLPVHAQHPATTNNVVSPPPSMSPTPNPAPAPPTSVQSEQRTAASERTSRPYHHGHQPSALTVEDELAEVDHHEALASAAAGPRDRAPALTLTIPPEGRAPPSPEDSPPEDPSLLQQQQQQDQALDLSLDPALSVVERVWLFSHSTNQFHKLYVGQAMPQLLDEHLREAPVQDAVTYIMPLLFQLADEAEAVREAFVPSVADVIWWFFARCTVLNDEEVPEGEYDPPVISVATFTATLGQLLLNPHTTVGQQARLQIVALLDRVRDPDAWPAADPRCLTEPERAFIEYELIYMVIIAIGQLDTLTPGLLGSEMIRRERELIEQQELELELSVIAEVDDRMDADQTPEQGTDDVVTSAIPAYDDLPPPPPQSTAEVAATAGGEVPRAAEAHSSSVQSQHDTVDDLHSRHQPVHMAAQTKPGLPSSPPSASLSGDGASATAAGTARAPEDSRPATAGLVVQPEADIPHPAPTPVVAVPQPVPAPVSAAAAFAPQPVTATAPVPAVALPPSTSASVPAPAPAPAPVPVVAPIARPLPAAAPVSVPVSVTHPPTEPSVRLPDLGAATTASSATHSVPSAPSAALPKQQEPIASSATSDKLQESAASVATLPKQPAAAVPSGKQATSDVPAASQPEPAISPAKQPAYTASSAKQPVYTASSVKQPAYTASSVKQPKSDASLAKQPDSAASPAPPLQTASSSTKLPETVPATQHAYTDRALSSHDDTPPTSLSSAATRTGDRPESAIPQPSLPLAASDTLMPPAKSSLAPPTMSSSTELGSSKPTSSLFSDSSSTTTPSSWLAHQPSSALVEAKQDAQPNKQATPPKPAIEQPRPHEPTHFGDLFPRSAPFATRSPSPQDDDPDPVARDVSVPTERSLAAVASTTGLHRETPPHLAPDFSPRPPSSPALSDSALAPTSSPSTGFSRLAPPGHIALPPQNAFQQNAAAENETSRPPSPAGAENAKAVQTALGPGTPFPTGDEVVDPMALYGLDSEAQSRRSVEVATTDDELAFGRMASMALIATVTSQCKKPFTDAVLHAFVAQVAAMRDDKEHWVRREASLALGALAKVVPLEVVVASLVPLFERWMEDDAWQVRQTTVYALPNILERLHARDRAALTVKVLRMHDQDEHKTVRTSMMEIMGEIIVTFKDDTSGPPKETLDLFFGDASLWETLPEQPKKLDDNAYWTPKQRTTQSRDPSRELTLAFNFPAVVLTLGPARWPELRRYFLYLVQCNSIFKVRRTMAASIGEIAKIIGEEQTRVDLLPVFEQFLNDTADDIRLKAISALPAFLAGCSVADRERIADSLEHVWTLRLRGWRERELLATELYEIAPLVGSRRHVISALIIKALRDSVCAVRDAAVAVVPQCYAEYLDKPAFRQSLLVLSESGVFRERHTFALCYRSIAMYCAEAAPQPEWWAACARLTDDPILDVRIGVSRAVGTLCETYFTESDRRPAHVTAVLTKLSRDQNDVVRSFVQALLKTGSVAKRAPRTTGTIFSHFHDPPPIVTSAGSSSEAGPSNTSGQQQIQIATPANELTTIESKVTGTSATDGSLLDEELALRGLGTLDLAPRTPSDTVADPPWTPLRRA